MNIAEQDRHNFRLLTEYREARASNDQERMREIRVEFGLPADLPTEDNDAARYRRHLEAIFRGPCRCRSWLCPACWKWGSELHRIPRPEACERHDDRCPACIAEHALHLAGDHEAARTHPHHT